MARVAVDTNVLARLLAGDKRIARALKGHSLLVSFITDIELHAYPSLTLEDERRIDPLLADCDVLGLSDSTRKAAIGYRKHRRLALTDAVIAGMAAACKVPLITADRAFQKCRASIEVRYIKT
jgi:predicted nucleic acid-binding protein